MLYATPVNVLTNKFLLTRMCSENLEVTYQVALVRGLKVRVGCQDRLLHVNSDADETLA